MATKLALFPVAMLLAVVALTAALRLVFGKTDNGNSWAFWIALAVVGAGVCLGADGEPPFTSAERHEVAAYMIDRWKVWASKTNPGELEKQMDRRDGPKADR